MHNLARIDVMRPPGPEQMLRRVIESLGTPTVSVGDDGRIAEWNAAAAGLLGFTRDEIVGRPLWDIVPAKERERAAQAFRRALEGERVDLHETERLHRDGKTVPLAITVGPLVDEAGAVVGVLGSLRDLRHDRAADEALKQSEAAFRALVEGSPEPIFVHRAGALVYVNPALVSMTGYARDELIGRSILDLLIHRDERQIVERRIREMAVKPGPLPPLEVHIRRKDGSIRISETVGVRIDFAGEAATLVIGRDVTERRQLQSRLMVSDRMASIGTLAAGIAHEINNPLSYVLGNLGSAADEIRAIAGASPSDRLRRLGDGLDEARAGADRIARIVRGLRVFSRADDERREMLDVRQVVEVAINMSFNEIRHRARLVRDFAPAPLVEADEARLCQVFINLIVNAAQSIPEGEADANEIRVVTATDKVGRAVIEVHDTGAGVPPELRSRIFDPFFTTKPVGVGTGLGLSICHGIVAALHGEICLESNRSGGSIFRVVLPAGSGGAKEETPRRPAASAPRRGRVLIVDDDARVAGAIAGMLPEHEVSVVYSGHEALRAVESGGAFDAIVCDLMMPDMTGMDLHEQLLAIRFDLAQRVVFVTGGAFTPRARAFFETVAARRLEKPFRAHELRALVHGLLE